MRPHKRLIVDGVVLRCQPPIIIEWCKTPDSANVDAPCGHLARSCVGAPQVCPRCGFPYCQSHYPHHIRRDVAPRDAWLTIIHKLRTALARAAEKGHARLRPVPVPDLEPEPEIPEAGS